MGHVFISHVSTSILTFNELTNGNTIFNQIKQQFI